MMKQKVMLIAGIFLLACSLAACAKQKSDKDTLKTETREPVVITESSVKTGLGAYAIVSHSVSAQEGNDGIGQADVYVAAVTINGDGNVLQCQLDCAITQVGFSGGGIITADASEMFLTEEELKHCDNSSLEMTIIGKNIDQIRKMEIQDSERGYIAAVLKAIRNSCYLGACQEDLLGIGIDTSISKSYDAKNDEDGQVQAYSSIVAVTLNDQEVITSCVVDAIQAKIDFDQNGLITSNISKEVITKTALKYDYGMLIASGIGKEWYEQAESFAYYTQGRTIQEVNKIPLDDGGHPMDLDLAASVTMHVNDSIAALNKAVENSQK